MPPIIEYFSGFGRRLRMLLRREQFDRDLEDEMRLHLELKEQELKDAGVPPEQTHSLAMRRMGNELLWREQSHQAWGWSWLENVLEDSYYGLRQFRKSPGFSGVAVLTLALGIGANTAIFSLIHAVLKPLPVPNPDQLYSLGDNQVCCDRTGIQDDFSLYSYALYTKVKEATPEFSELAAFQSKPGFQPWSIRRGVSGVADSGFGQFVSGNYFSMFGIDAVLGRTLAAADDQPNAPPVAVMSYRAWKQQYGADRSVVGSRFTINGQRLTVVGVMPPGFFGDTLRTHPPDFWVPLATQPILSLGDSVLNVPTEYWLYSIGRLKPEVRPEDVEARVNGEIRRWLSAQPGLTDADRQRIAKVHMALTPASSGITTLWSYYADGVRMLAAISGLVLLLACANIANLLLARSMADHLQTAVRMALAATRARLIRQMLTEGILLSLLGGVAGLIVAYAMTRTILALVFRGADYAPIDANPSLPVLAFAFFLSLLTGVIFSVTPAWIASNAHPVETLRSAGRSRRNSFALPQKVFLALQATVALVLLVGAGLLTRTLQNLEYQQLGFDTHDRLIVRLNPALAGYTPESLPKLYQQLEQRFARLPGVSSESLALNCPAVGATWGGGIRIEGRRPAANPVDDNAYYDLVSSHYFETIGTRLLRGRLIGENDTPASRHVAVVNQSFAHKFFPNEDPIGKHFGEADGHSRDYEIVGIVEDAKYRSPESPADPMFFRPLLQLEKYENSDDQRYQALSNYIDSVQLHVAGHLENLEPMIRQTLADIDPNLTVISIADLNESVSMSLTGPRLMARLTSLFGLLALILASVGLYGVAAYTVALRRTEIGIRMALGADRANVTAMILCDTVLPIGLGLGVGIPVALLGGRAIADQLYGVTSYDPSVLSSAVLVLSMCALFAGFVPAIRAASTAPMQALRTE
jgi:predicted permease